MNHCDQSVTVIGGGIIGVCCALSLQKKDLHVSVVDEGILHRKASYGNAGVISPWACVPQSMPGVWKYIPKWLVDKSGPVSFSWSYLPTILPWAVKFINLSQHENVKKISAAMSALTRPNVTLYRQHLANSGQLNLIKDSCYLFVHRDKQAFSSSSFDYQLRDAINAPIEIIRANEIQEIEPAISSEYQSALLIKNQARAINPGKLLQVLTERFLSLGGKLIKAKVESIKPDNADGWELGCQGENITTDSVVVSAGIWSVDLLKPLGVKVPLISERGYHLEFQQPGVNLNNSIMDVESKFVTSYMENGIRSAGTAEFAHKDAKPNYRRSKLLVAQTKRMLPNINTKDTREWIGVRPSFPDSLPVIDKVQGFDGLFVAFGHSHYGLGMAPKTGQVLADVVRGDASDIDIESYRIDRFS